MSIKNYEKLVNLIVDRMRTQAVEANTFKAEVDISGGVDSAVIAALACKAFGPENVIGVYSSINSSEKSARLASLVAEKFGFHFLKLDLTSVFNNIVNIISKAFEDSNIVFPDINDPENRKIFGSLRSCLRAPIGRFVNRCFGGGIREGTGNRDEDELLRFYQKGGDGEVDSNWIEGLFKSEVWQLASYLEVPKEVIEVEPTPDLLGFRSETDEEELLSITGVPLTYTRPEQIHNKTMGTIEWVTRLNDTTGIITGEYKDTDPREIFTDFDEMKIHLINAIRKMEKITRHKSLPPPFINRKELLDADIVD